MHGNDLAKFFQGYMSEDGVSASRQVWAVELQHESRILYRRSCLCHAFSFASVCFAMLLIMDITHPSADTACVSDTMGALGSHYQMRPSHTGTGHATPYYTLP
jgi:hypothetical protein